MLRRGAAGRLRRKAVRRREQRSRLVAAAPAAAAWRRWQGRTSCSLKGWGAPVYENPGLLFVPAGDAGSCRAVEEPATLFARQAQGPATGSWQQLLPPPQVAAGSQCCSVSPVAQPPW